MGKKRHQPLQSNSISKRRVVTTSSGEFLNSEHFTHFVLFSAFS